MRLKTPVHLHEKIVEHQKHLDKNSDYVVTLEEAAYDLWAASVQALPHLKSE